MRRYSSYTTLPIFVVITLLSATPALPQSSGGSRTEKPSGRKDLEPSTINQLLRQRTLPSESQSPDMTDTASTSRADNRAPDDDAPIEDLIEYWSRRRPNAESAGSSGPSEIIRERLLSAAERRPWILPKLYDFLPQNSDTHDRLYRTLTKDPAEFENIEENNWRASLYWRLQSTTRYLRDELIEAVRTRDNNDPDKLDEIKALAELDWHTAKPLLEKIVAGGMSLSHPTALSMLYENAAKGTGAAQADAYRAILKQLVVDGSLSASSRRTVLESLLKDGWAGQEEWYVALFGDSRVWNSSPSSKSPLINTFFISGAGGSLQGKIERMPLSISIPTAGPSFLSIALSLNPDKWIPIVAGLTNHMEAAVRDAAASSLAEFLNDSKAEKKGREDAARSLLPWLTDPEWTSAPGRADFIFKLAEIDMPESIPGLLWVLENDKDHYVREAAVEALTRSCDPGMAAALKRVLSIESNAETRWITVTALARCGGFSDGELATAVEAYANMAATVEGEQAIVETSRGKTDKTLPLSVRIGQILCDSDMSWATEGFAEIMFDRLKESGPGAAKLTAAKFIIDKIRALPLNIARTRLVERISEGSANIDDLKLAMRIRGTLAEELRAELSEIVRQGGYAGGIAAMALHDRDRQMEILKGKDAKAQIALLAGARYLLEKLPIGLLRELIISSDKTLAMAVENYLAIEGSAAARKLLMTRRPNELMILGDISCLADYQIDLGAIKAWEEQLRGEMIAPGGVEEIYALAPAAPTKRMKGMVIRVQRRKAEISVYDIEGNRKTRALAESEFRELKDFTSLPEVEDLGPESWRLKKPIVPYEYLHLTKEGGRRLILAGYGAAPKSPSLHEKLSDLFYRIGKSGE